MKVADIITNKFLEAIKTSGKLPWQKPWRCIEFSNAVTGKKYNGINVLSLALFGSDTDFLTFNQAKENGGNIKKGSKGIQICYMNALDKKDKNGDVIVNSKGKTEKYNFLRYSTVFNLSDTEGCDKLKEKALKRKKVIDFKPIEICEKLLANYGINIKHSGNMAFYSPAIHAITMPDKNTFKSIEHYYCILFHEVGHSVAKEIGVDIASGFGTDPYAKEELVAELFANFCLSYCGIDSSNLFDNSLAYLQSWSERFTKDGTLLISAASKATKRFNWLLEKSGMEAKEETTEEIAA